MTVYRPRSRTVEEVARSTARYLVRVTLAGRGPADLYAGRVLPFVDGRLSLSYNEHVNLTGTLTVGALPEWTAQDADAALHPEAGMDLLIEHGVRDDDGADHWWSYGYARPLEHSVSTKGGEVAVELGLIGRDGIIRMAGAPGAVIVEPGSGILATIRDALTRVAPFFPIDLPLDDDVISNGITLAEGTGDDLWAACRDVVASMGRRLVVEADGVIRAPRLTLPTNEPVTPVEWLEWESGVNYARVVHEVAARWEEQRPDDAADDWTPAGGEEIARDPRADSLPPWVPTIRVVYGGDESILSSAEHARAAALASLAQRIDQAVTGAGRTLPSPLLRPGIVVEDPNGSAVYRVTRLDVDLDTGSVTTGLGARHATFGVRLAEALTPNHVSETTEIVTSVSPPLSVLASDPDGPEREFAVTDGTRGVQVGDTIRVRADGRGRRFGIISITPRTLATFNGKAQLAGSTFTIKTPNVGGDIPAKHGVFSGTPDASTINALISRINPLIDCVTGLSNKPASVSVS